MAPGLVAPVVASLGVYPAMGARNPGSRRSTTVVPDGARCTSTVSMRLRISEKPRPRSGRGARLRQLPWSQISSCNVSPVRCAADDEWAVTQAVGVLDDVGGGFVHGHHDFLDVRLGHGEPVEPAPQPPAEARQLLGPGPQLELEGQGPARRVQEQERDVVARPVLRHQRGEEVVGERVEVGRRVERGPPQPIESLVERFLATLDEAVGVHDHDVAGLDLRDDLVVRRGFDDAQRHAEPAGEERRRACRGAGCSGVSTVANHERRWVARARVAKLAGLRVVERDRDRRHVGVRQRTEVAVQAFERLRRAVLVERAQLERGPQPAGRGRGRETVADDVADREEHPPVLAGDHVVPVAADPHRLAAGPVARGEPDVAEAGKLGREQAALERLRGGLLALVTPRVLERERRTPHELLREGDVGGVEAPSGAGLDERDRAERLGPVTVQGYAEERAEPEAAGEVGALQSETREDRVGDLGQQHGPPGGGGLHARHLRVGWHSGPVVDEVEPVDHLGVGDREVRECERAVLLALVDHAEVGEVGDDERDEAPHARVGGELDGQQVAGFREQVELLLHAPVARCARAAPSSACA